MKLETKLDLLLNEESAYDKFFNMKLKEWKIKSPAELSKKKKIEFFNMIDKEWKAKNEKD